jgi:catechol 2,3-dioxygenase-like lactoylglutathione lyase family enzyme
MKASPEMIVEDFERGRLSRRQLVRQLMALGAGAAAAGTIAFPSVAHGQAATQPATQRASTFQATGIDHLALSVTDVGRAVAFYEKHLGLRLTRGGGDAGSAFMSTSGTDFLALFRGEAPGLHHFSFAIPRYDAADAARRIEAAGLKPRREGNRVYFPDPDGLTVQVHAGRGIAS